MKLRSHEIWLLVLAVVALTITSVVVVGAAVGIRSSQSPMAINCLPLHPVSNQVQISLDDGGAMMGGSSMMVAMSADKKSVPAGEVTFVASNYGRINHEFLVLPLAADGPGTRRVGTDGKIDELSSVAEASRSCASGVGDGIAPRTRGWVTVNLAPGTYEVLCDVPWHYANGMFTTITVR